MGDHGWIAAVAGDVYGDLGDYATIIRSWLDHPGVLTYVEEDPGAGAAPRARGFTLLGFYEPSGTTPGDYVADLLAIGVDREYQRQGIGSRLLEHAIHLAGFMGQGRQVSEIRLTVAETNEVGQRFFTSFGFRVMDDDHGRYDRGQRAIRMSRAIP